MPSKSLTVVVMGVSGCGKSTIAEQLAQKIGAHFKDADELHPARNIELMSAGKPLTDIDRLPWLELVASYARNETADDQTVVIACSALKRKYRDIINTAGDVLYVYLNGSVELIASRMSSREGHFMPEQLLQSQFDVLEVPDAKDEHVVIVDIDVDIESIVLSAEQQVRSHALFAE